MHAVYCAAHTVFRFKTMFRTFLTLLAVACRYRLSVFGKDEGFKTFDDVRTQHFVSAIPKLVPNYQLSGLD